MSLADPENFGVRCLSSYLLSNGHDIHILQLKSCSYNRSTTLPKNPMMLSYGNGSLLYTDAPSISSCEYRLIEKKLSDWNPDIVGISIRGVLEQLFPPLSVLVRKACPKAFWIAGGIGPTLTPEFYLEHGADAVVRGEGEEPLLDFIKALEKGRNWKNIKNICYATDKDFIKNPMRPRERNLSRFPVPLDDPDFFSYIENDTYEPIPMNKTDIAQSSPNILKAYHCMTSRGCLGACTYCSSQSVYNLYEKYNKHTKKMTIRDDDHVFKELNIAKNDGYKFIYFHDDFFVRPINQLQNFLRRYSNEINLPFHAFFHPQQLLQHDELIDAIIDSGNITFTFGIQNACKNFCEKIYKRKAFSNAYPQLYEHIVKRGGNITFQFIIGNPLEKADHFEANLDFIKQFKYDITHKTFLSTTCFYLMFFPGVELTQMFPNINQLPRNAEDWFYKCLLLDIRRLIDDKNFECIRDDPQYRTDLEKLRSLRHLLVRDQHYAYVFDSIRRLRGKEVYFWGCGEMYRRKKHLFNEVKPICMLLDIPLHEMTSIDGLPIKHPDEILLGRQPRPIVVFSRDQGTIFRKILKKYPAYKDIISCAIF